MSARQAAARSRPPRAAEPEPRNTHQAGRRATRLCLRSGAGAAPSARPGCSLAGSARRTARKNSIAAFSMYVGPVSFKPCRCAQWPPRRVVASTVAGLPRHSAVGRPLHAQGAQSSATPCKPCMLQTALAWHAPVQTHSALHWATLFGCQHKLTQAYLGGRLHM